MKRKKDSQRTTWLLVGAGAAMVAGRLMDRGLAKGWRTVKDEEPPSFDRGDSWSKALAWTALSAAAIGTVELAARRGADLGLKRLTGKRAQTGA